MTDLPVLGSAAGQSDVAPPSRHEPSADKPSQDEPSGGKPSGAKPSEGLSADPPHVDEPERGKEVDHGDAGWDDGLPDIDDPDFEEFARQDLISQYRADHAPADHEPADHELADGELPDHELDDHRLDGHGLFAGHSTEDSDPHSDGRNDTRGRRRRTRWIVLGIFVALLAILAGIVGPLAWRILTRQSASLAAPATLAGLSADTSDNANQTADYLRTAVAARIALDTSVGAIYKDPASKDRDVLFFGGTATLLTPDRQLDEALALLNDDSGGMSGVHAVDAGPLGGSMKCGTTPGDGGPLVVCGWADSASIAVALFPGRTVDQAAELLRQMRAAMEHRG